MGKILYFVNGVPSQDEAEDARLAGALIRNAQAWHESDFVEECDSVMGNPEVIPAPYRHLLKKAESKPKRKKDAADS